MLVAARFNALNNLPRKNTRTHRNNDEALSPVLFQFPSADIACGWLRSHSSPAYAGPSKLRYRIGFYFIERFQAAQFLGLEIACLHLARQLESQPDLIGHENHNKGGEQYGNAQQHHGAFAGMLRNFRGHALLFP